jgi:predicted homoserine dehydrogenase-like protein
MNFHSLFGDLASRRIRIAISGAKGDFGRSLLVQCRAIPSIDLVALCDIDLDGLTATMSDLGFASERMAVCTSAEEARAAQGEGRVALVPDHRLLAAFELDALVEATGRPEVSVTMAEEALTRGVHVIMATKESESVAGPYLAALARDKGVVYTTPDGDQPSNLIGLVTWAQCLGFEIVAAGKASEYDYIYDPAAESLSYTDRRIDVPGFAELWDLGTDVPGRVQARSRALDALPQSATPDYCEMNVVANAIGFPPSCNAMSYPICRIGELADIFVPREDGGILDRTGVVDVFNCLRRTDEVSFGGGVFVIVRCTDSRIWEVLRGKGHVVSRDGRHACIYLPYHLMGLETPTSILSAVLLGKPTGAPAPLPHAVMAARAERDFAAGEVLRMGGHHHVIEGTSACLLPISDEVSALAPFYVAADRRLTRPVAKGNLIPLSALDLEGSVVARAWEKSLALRSSRDAA